MEKTNVKTVEAKVGKADNADERKVSFSDKVKVVGSKKARSLKPGVVKEVHPILAERLVGKGEAEYYKEK